MPQRIIIIAGPNGAGKTTFAWKFLSKIPDCPRFLNADLIAAGLSPLDPQLAAIRAGRLMIAEIQRLVRTRETFAFETTLSGRSYARHIPRWKSLGYRVELLFLQLASPQLALERVRHRVLRGGHDLPETIVRRRFLAGQHRFKDTYCDLVDSCECYDNSGPAPIFLGRGGSE